MAMARSSSGGMTQSQGEGAILGAFFPIDNALYGPYCDMNFTIGPVRLKFTYLR